MQTNRITLGAIVMAVVTAAANAVFDKVGKSDPPPTAHASATIQVTSIPIPAVPEPPRPPPTPTPLAIIEAALREKAAATGVVTHIDLSGDALTIDVDGHLARIFKADAEALKIASIGDMNARLHTIEKIQSRCRSMHDDDDAAAFCVDESYTPAERNLAKAALLVEGVT